jgi:hypothetical protein
MAVVAGMEAQFEAARARLVDYHLWIGDAPDDAAVRLRQGWSLRRRLIDDVTMSAMQHATAHGGSLDDFHRLASAGVAVVDHLQASLCDSSEADVPLEKEWNFWRHERDPWAVIQANKQPRMDRVGVETAASDYLKLPFRPVRLERTLVDVLVAMELYAFSEEMLTPMPMFFRWLPTQSPLKQKHVVRRYIGGQLSNSVLFLGGAWLAGDIAGGWIAGGVVFLFVAFLIWGTIALPFAWRHQARARRHVRNCMLSMVETYSELASNGAVSALRLREVAAKAGDRGVVWPGPLFAILDDNIARSGRL